MSATCLLSETAEFHASSVARVSLVLICFVRAAEDCSPHKWSACPSLLLFNFQPIFVMHALSIVATIILAPLALAQDPTLGLQAIRAHFTQSALVPDLFTSFQPSALIGLNFEGAVF